MPPVLRASLNLVSRVLPNDLLSGSCCAARPAPCPTLQGAASKSPCSAVVILPTNLTRSCHRAQDGGLSHAASAGHGKIESRGASPARGVPPHALRSGLRPAPRLGGAAPCSTASCCPTPELLCCTRAGQRRSGAPSSGCADMRRRPTPSHTHSLQVFASCQYCELTSSRSR